MTPSRESDARGADIHLEQLPNGYWRGTIDISIPSLAVQHFEGDSFHNADEVLVWVRHTLLSVTAYVSA